jgi:hypothetical protein
VSRSTATCGTIPFPSLHLIIINTRYRCWRIYTKVHDNPNS